MIANKMRYVYYNRRSGEIFLYLENKLKRKIDMVMSIKVDVVIHSL